jgi:hypothetical protein
MYSFRDDLGTAICTSSCGSEWQTCSSLKWRPMKACTHPFINPKFARSSMVCKNSFSVGVLFSWKSSLNIATSEDSTYGVSATCLPRWPRSWELPASSCEPLVPSFERVSQVPHSDRAVSRFLCVLLEEPQTIRSVRDLQNAVRWMADFICRKAIVIRSWWIPSATRAWVRFVFENCLLTFEH